MKLLSMLNNISLHAANVIYGLSNGALVAGAVFVLLGTIGAIYSSGIRERFSDERTASNEAQTASANARAAEAEQRALEAAVTLAQFRQPRTLNFTQQNAVTEKLGAFPNLQFDAAVIRDDPETYQLLDMIVPALTAAGWQQVNWNDGQSVLRRPGKPDVGEWAATNVIIAVPHNLISRFWPAASSFALALTAQGIPAQAQDAQGMTVKNNDVLHVLVGRKT